MISIAYVRDPKFLEVSILPRSWKHYLEESLDFLKDDSIFRRHRFLSFEETNSFYKFATLNKLRIVDIPETQLSGQMDYHFNKEGHETLASKIINEIKNTYLF
jgi:hypothetical protein